MSGIKFDTSSLMQGLIATPNKTDTAIRMFADVHALNMQNDCREQARWTDRTGQARQRLTGSVQRTDTGYRIVVSHGVDYGAWLELAMEKRFAIIEPIVRMTSPYVMQDFEKLLDKLR